MQNTIPPAPERAPTSWHDLPEEIVGRVVDHLPPLAAAQMAATSKALLAEVRQSPTCGAATLQSLGPVPKAPWRHVQRYLNDLAPGPRARRILRADLLAKKTPTLADLAASHRLFEANLRDWQKSKPFYTSQTGCNPLCTPLQAVQGALGMGPQKVVNRLSDAKQKDKEELTLNSACLQTLPDLFGRLGRLKKLSLYKCTNLQSVPPSVGQLSHLTYLDLSFCESVVTLPNSLGDLPNLEQLFVTGCTALTALPSTLRQLSRLQKLFADCCLSLAVLPDGLEQLPRLEKLYLRGSIKLSGPFPSRAGLQVTPPNP